MPQLTVDGYPTIVIATADGRIIDAGEAERSLDGLTEFLVDHAAVPIERQLLAPGEPTAAAPKDEL